MYDLDNPLNPRGTPDYLVGNNEAPGALLAALDFENAAYSVGATNYAVTDLLTDGFATGFTPDDISGADGWAPAETCAAMFGAPMAAVLGEAGGFVVVFDAAWGPGGATKFGAIDVTGSVSVTLQLTPGADLLGCVATYMSLTDSVVGEARTKWTARFSPADFAVAQNGVAEQNTIPAEGEWATWDVSQSFLENYGQGWKVYSVKFYAADAVLSDLLLA